MNEQLRMLDHSSDDFIDRYNFYTSLLIVAALNPTRHTLFLFPGGMASKLKRANKAWQAAGPASQVFTYEELWVTVGLNLLIYGDVFHWGELMAASVITTLPVVILYMFIHRWMVEGLAAGSVKG